jgi:hypothetical protein
MTIPQSFCVKADDFMKECIATQQCSNLLALTLTLYKALYHTTAINPWIQCLLESPEPDLPFSWSSEKLVLIEGTSIHPKNSTNTLPSIYTTTVLPFHKSLPSHYIPSLEYTKFTTALKWVISRTLQSTLNYEVSSTASSLVPEVGVLPHDVLPHDGTPHHGTQGWFMLPLFDMINHSQDPSCRNVILKTSYNAVTQSDEWTVVTLYEVKSNDELLQGYGNHGTESLLRCYGFTQPSVYTKVHLSIEDVVRYSGVRGSKGGSKGGSEVSTATETRLEALRECNVIPFNNLYTITRNGVTDDLLTTLLVLIMEEEEFRVWLDETEGMMMGKEFFDDNTLPLFKVAFGDICKALKHDVNKFDDFDDCVEKNFAVDLLHAENLVLECVVEEVDGWEVEDVEDSDADDEEKEVVEEEEDEKREEGGGKKIKLF